MRLRGFVHSPFAKEQRWTEVHVTGSSLIRKKQTNPKLKIQSVGTYPNSIPPPPQPSTSSLQLLCLHVQQVVASDAGSGCTQQQQVAVD